MKNAPGRRQFLTTVTKAVGTSLLINTPFLTKAGSSTAAPFTVGQVMDLILKTIPGAPFPKTVDTLKSGSPSQTVTGIVSTMFTTVEVIEKTIAAGANFIIAHEPTFYNHLDETDWLNNDPVFKHKHDLLTKNNIAVWRFHDYWHSHKPDGIRAGMLSALGWEKQVDPENPQVLLLPSTTVGQVITHAKQKLGIKQVRIVGDTAQKCQRVLLLPGAAGGRNQIMAIEKAKPDLVLCGEASEWETPEYIRDARRQGQTISLVVLGHIMSEAAGMEWLVSWLQPKVPGVKVSYIPSGNPFSYE
ncbi:MULTISPECIES: Nif3-like dinuclear metal center hexameric protein [unclassified Spirosoma]|uniref:Nif3-like dinuclear metal center hexameric protein n=1 Tax=unclassified Spirosoma TaxID=2621999 RepID=UPI0009596EC3|nr:MULTISPECIES: Nif3-like dinuclear metal center hexameric protein [unclassified Spirosoma]MBN8822292.1 Nif3-like dinuclear metal center hexameric protein [Spirosoma sp.]OJW72403.1 MAG: NGG1p interacting factor NIF3 [Spirosoma sp. 48-14]